MAQFSVLTALPRISLSFPIATIKMRSNGSHGGGGGSASAFHPDLHKVLTALRLERGADLEVKTDEHGVKGLYLEGKQVLTGQQMRQAEEGASEFLQEHLHVLVVPKSAGKPAVLYRMDRDGEQNFAVWNEEDGPATVVVFLGTYAGSCSVVSYACFTSRSE